MPSPESTIQIDIFNWIREQETKHPVLRTIFHTPNSFFGTNFGVITHLKKMGMRKGVYDIIVPVSKGNYAGLWIEVKKPKGKLSLEQLQYIDLINNHSDFPTLFKTTYNAGEGIQIIKDYLKIKEEV
jgi:hypothetical protein